MSTDIGVPDLSKLPQAEGHQLLEEVKTAAERDEKVGPGDTLHDYFQKSWGQTAAKHLEPACSKFFNMPSGELDQATRVYMGLARVVVADTEASLALKAQSEAMDNRIAVVRSALDSYPAAMAELPYPNLHPMPDSFMSYCEHARGTLNQSGVEISLTTRIESLERRAHGFDVGLHDTAADSSTTEFYDLVVWTGKLNRLEQILLKTDSLSPHIKSMGMHLFYHFADASQLSQTGYFQNYDHDIDVFRWSSLGVYSDQIDADGKSFCCTEIPDHGGVSTGESHALRHWQELRTLGLVEGEYSGAPAYIHAPNCFDRFLDGFGGASKAVMERIDGDFDNIVYAMPTEFGRINAALGLHERVRALH